MAKLKVGGHDVDSLLKPIAPVTAAPATPAAPAAPVDVPQSMLSRAGDLAAMVNPMSLTNIKSNIKALGNAPASAKKFGAGVVEAVTNPVETAKTLGLATLGGIVNATGMTIPKQNPFDKASPDDPTIAKAVEVANAIGGDYKAAYGSFDAIRRTYETDPVRVLADMSMLASGGGGLAKVGGLTKTAAGLSEVAKTVDPLMLAARGTGTTLRAGARLVEPFTNPGAVAGRTLVNSMVDPQAAVNALEATRGERATPGYTPTLSERLVGQGVNDAGTAGLQAGLMNTNQKVGRGVFGLREQSLNALNDQLARIESRAKANLNAAAPDVGQLEPGAAITARAKTLEKDVRRNVIDPAYKTAYREAGNTPIDIADAAAAAEEILGTKGTAFDPSLAPHTVKELAKIGPTEVVVTGSEFPTGVSGGGGKVTLEQLDQIRKAINKDIGQAKTSGAAGGVDARLRNLMTVHNMLDEAVANSNLSDTAKAAYADALSKYQTELVRPFKTGVPAKMRRTTSLNEPGVRPEDVVTAFLKSESGAKQFNTAFRGDPVAAQSMATGVVDLFRSKAVNPDGTLNLEAADSFVKKYGHNLDTLQNAGIDVRGQIDAVRDVATVMKEAPEAITKTAAQDLSAFSDADLHDLALVAEDIRRSNVVEKMATTGSRPGPAYRAGSEAAGNLGIAAEQAPQSTNRAATLIRNIMQRSQNRISKRAAARLAYVMYTNPNAAISLINDTLAKSRPIKVPDLRAATAAGQLNNAMSPENRNAMAR
jgi:hypothetical protein